MNKKCARNHKCSSQHSKWRHTRITKVPLRVPNAGNNQTGSSQQSQGYQSAFSNDSNSGLRGSSQHSQLTATIWTHGTCFNKFFNLLNHRIDDIFMYARLYHLQQAERLSDEVNKIFWLKPSCWMFQTRRLPSLRQQENERVHMHDLHLKEYSKECARMSNFKGHRTAINKTILKIYWKLNKEHLIKILLLYRT
jgi:hypothetical protein